jgi:hypothetical protein
MLNFYSLLYFDIFRHILSSLQGFVLVLGGVQSAYSGRIISIENSIFYTPNPCWFHLEDVDMNTSPNPRLTILWLPANFTHKSTLFTWVTQTYRLCFFSSIVKFQANNHFLSSPNVCEAYMAETTVY